jgi:cytochrome c553
MTSKHTLWKQALLLALLALMALWSTSARAEERDGPGAWKSIYCAYCHGYDGNPLSADVPRLAGQTSEAFLARLKAINQDGSMHQSMMKAYITGDFTEAEMADLARFYARQKPR